MKLVHVIVAAMLTGLFTNSLSADELVAKFATAQPDFSPVPIWWWSGDRIERDRLREQLEKMAEGGIHNAIILNLAPSGPLYGSAADDPLFLSEEWWDLFEYALQQSKRLGIKLWFYDQFGFSGAGLQAKVVRDNPDFRGVTLRRTVSDVTGPTEVELRTPGQGTALAAFAAEIMEGQCASDVPRWIMDNLESGHHPRRSFRRAFELKSIPQQAHLAITADDSYIVYVNGVKVGEDSGPNSWRKAEQYDVTPHLRVGENVVAAVAWKGRGHTALLLKLVVSEQSGKGAAQNADSKNDWCIVSNTLFQVSADPPEGWLEPGFDDSSWVPAYGYGPINVYPWHAKEGGVDPGSPSSLGVQIKNVRNLTNKIADGTLRVAVPAGRHRVQLFYTIPGGFDYQNPAAGAALMDIIHGEMERRFGDELGKTIGGSFQDEFPAVPFFSTRFLEEFRKRNGYDLTERLPALYDDVVDAEGANTIQMRCDAVRVAAELAEEAFFIPLYNWHEKYGMLCGYDQNIRDADPIRGERYYVDYFRTMRHYSAPGNDQAGDIKPHQSIADLYNRPRVWLEAFHTSGWGQTLEEIATLLHPWLAEGATLYNPHAIYYSTHGSFWEWAPPDTGWRQPYFVHYKLLADYVSRLCYILSQGRHAVDAAVVHPASTIHAYFGFDSPAPIAQLTRNTYWGVQHQLRREKIDYLVIDEDSIQRAEIKDGLLSVGSVQLRILVLPEIRVLAGKTLSKLVQFVESGGKVIVIGESPDQAADRTLTATKFADLARKLHGQASHLKGPGGIVRAVLKTVPRDLKERHPVLHRKIEDRDFYFVLSDAGTTAKAHERQSINRRKLWDTPAAKGGRMSFGFGVDGIPERWDALTGQVKPIHNYRRAEGRTRVSVDLASTPAPLIAIRPAKKDEPIAVESDLEVLDWQREGVNAIILHGLPRFDRDRPQHRARVEFADAAYAGSQKAEQPVQIDVPGPLACQLEPTIDNRDGDFVWPPYDGPLPVEVRSFKFRQENPSQDTSQWKSPEFDDSKWGTVIASYGPRAEFAGPLKLADGESFETLAGPPAKAGPFKPLEYSLRLGINEDPIYPTALGGKGRIPEEFIHIAPVRANDVYLVRTRVIVPAESVGAEGVLASILRVGGEANKRAFLNNKEVKFEAGPAGRVLRAKVQLQPGENKLEILAARTSGGSLRLFYQFLPDEQIDPDPLWIWNATPSPSGKVHFVKTIDVPGEVRSAAIVVALAEQHQIRINGKMVADQGEFDPYFTGRSEWYDIAKFLHKGENRLEIEARDPGEQVGLILDGLVELTDGRKVAFVSDASFHTVRVTEGVAVEAPAQVITAPVARYFGETATLFLRPRIHPLPLAGWLVDQAPPAEPFDRLIYTRRSSDPPAGWYRFLIPPGATKLNMKITGKPELYIDGQNVPIIQSEAYLSALLPEPNSPKRVAALRTQPVRGLERGAAITEPITFEMGPGRIPLGSWDEVGLPHYSGGVRYAADVELPKISGSRVMIDLGRVRGTAEVAVNGKACGVRIWHPYRFDITDGAKAGKNRIEIRVFNTLGPHFGVGHPSWHVFLGHTKSGIWGPISVQVAKPVELRLEKVATED